MSVPYIDSSHLVPIAVLTASLAGSGHCVSMCGGLVSSLAKTKSSWCAYQLGRLVGYLGLGYLAGFLGQMTLGSIPETRFFSGFATAVLSLTLAWAGVRIWKKKAPHFSWVPDKVLKKAFRLSGGSSFFSGVFTAFLPCGWLHVFLLAAAASQSSFRGAGVLFVFWMGSLPALALAPVIIDKILGPVQRKSPRIAGSLLIFAAILNIAFKVVPEFKKNNFVGQTSVEGTDLECHSFSKK